MNKEGTYAEDFEISESSSILNKNIIVYRKNINEKFEFINSFKANNNNIGKIILIFKNYNHFNLLLKKGINIHRNKYDKNYFNKIHRKIEKNIKTINKENIKKKEHFKLFDKVYVNYNRKGCQNLYNKIYKFLKLVVIPDRIKSTYQKFVKKINL